MKRSFGYIRVSTLKQGDGVSLEAQKTAIAQFAERNDIQIVEWFEEKQTAAKRGRPVFGAMLKLLRQRKVEGVVMHKIDRSARNFADWAKIGDLADEGIDVHFATESLDFRSRGGRLSADIQAVIAADYIRNLRDETLKGMYGRLKQGLYPWEAPTGYVDNGGGKPKTLDPVKAPLVRQLFELYASGAYSILSLRSEMERRGLRNLRGTPLTKSGIEKVLNNPFYCGVIRIKTTGETYQGVHEPIISAELFQRAQDVKAGKCGKKVTRHNHLFRGLFRCGHCGRGMIPERQRGHVYYRCQYRNCPTKCVREEELEQAVLNVLATGCLTEAQTARVLEAVANWQRNGEDAALERAAELQLSQLDARLNSLTDGLLDGLIDKGDYLRRREALLVERAVQDDQLRQLRERYSYVQMIRAFLERLKNLADSYRFSAPAEKREIVQIALSNRRVYGRNASAIASDWLRETAEALSAYGGDPQRPKYRSSRNMRRAHIEKLAALAGSAEAKRLIGLGESENRDEGVECLAA